MKPKPPQKRTKGNNDPAFLKAEFLSSLEEVMSMLYKDRNSLSRPVYSWDLTKKILLLQWRLLLITIIKGAPPKLAYQIPNIIE